MRKWTMLTLLVLLALLAGCAGNTDTTTTQTPTTTTTPTTAPTTTPITPPPAVKDTCTVTFCNYDGAQIGTLEVEKGASVDMTQAPAAEHAYKNWYTFTGWDQSLENITEDITATAQYAYNAIPDEVFEFVLLDDDTYGIRLADPEKDYSYLALEGYVGFPEEHNGKPVTRILKEGMKATKHKLSLLGSTTDVLVPSSYKIIENRAFDINLNRLTVAEGVEEIWAVALVFIEKSDGDESVEISLPSSLTVIEPVAFSSRCQIEMKDGAVYSYHAIRKEILADGGTTLVWKNTAGVVNMVIDRNITNLYPGLFATEDGLSSVTFEGWITELPVGTLSRCRALISVSFQYGLEKIWGPEQLPEIQKTLRSGDSLEELAYGNFTACSYLNFTIPETVTYIGDYTFLGCDTMFKDPIVISKDVTYIGTNAFSTTGNMFDCPSITVDPENPKYYSVNDSCLIERGTGIHGGDTFMVYASQHPQTEFAIPNGVTTIHPFAFMGVFNLKSLTVPEGVESLPDKFLYATLIMVDENGNTVSVTGLEKLSLPSTLKTVGGGLTQIWGGYWLTSLASISAQALKELVFPNGNNIETITTSAMFLGANITSFTFSKNTTMIGNYSVIGDDIQFIVEEGNEKYISIDGSVYEKLGDNKLKLILATRSASVTVLDLTGLGGYTLTEIGENACNSNKHITKAILPEGLEKIGSGAFGGCSALTEVKMPTTLQEIGRDVFYNCSELTSVTVPANVKTIGDYAFAGCVKLETIYIPKSVESIGKGAFQGCSALVSVVFEERDTAITIGQNAFMGTQVKEEDLP